MVTSKCACKALAISPKDLTVLVRVAVVAVFGLLFLQVFDPFAHLIDRLGRFLERFAQHVFLLVEPRASLVLSGHCSTEGVIFLAQGSIFLPQGFEFFLPVHTITVADCLCFRQMPGPFA